MGFPSEHEDVLSQKSQNLLMLFNCKLKFALIASLNAKLFNELRRDFGIRLLSLTMSFYRLPKLTSYSKGTDCNTAHKRRREYQIRRK